MGWSGGFEDVKGRPAGYGVSAICDAEGCEAALHRGLAYVCGTMHGGEGGCGLYFCAEHEFDHDCTDEMDDSWEATDE